MDLTEASQQPNVPGALQQLLLSKVRSASQAQEASQKRAEALQQYQQALTEEPYGSYTPTELSFDTWLENMGTMDSKSALAKGVGAGGRFRGELEALRQKGRVASAKAGYEDTKDMGKLDLYELQALKGLAGGKQGLSPTVKMDRDGNMVVFDPLSQSTRVVHSSQRGEYQRIWSKAYEKAVAEEMPDPERYAHEQALSVLQRGPKAGLPEGGSGAGTPAVSPSWLSSQPPDTRAKLNFPGETPYQIKSKIDRIQDPQARAEAQAAFDRQFGSETPPSIEYRDRRQQAQDSGYGAEEGKGLYEEKSNLTTLHSANSKLISQLNLLESVYGRGDLPEGEVAPMLQSFRSNLKGLGIEVDPSVGLTDMANAIATGLSLGLKNADGKNLMPGAISNFENQKLDKMGPALQLTQEGRMALIKFMKAGAAANLRLAQEAAKMAAENGDRLPASWAKRKARIELEENAKLKILSDQISQQFGIK